MDEYGKKKIEILENKDDKIVLQEKTVYKLDRKDINMKLQNIAMHKESLIGQSREIKRQFDMLTEEENKLKESLQSLEGGKLEVI